jgi:hypothetical protein
MKPKKDGGKALECGLGQESVRVDFLNKNESKSMVICQRDNAWNFLQLRSQLTKNNARG